jgi:hypothetical protein
MAAIFTAPAVHAAFYLAADKINPVNLLQNKPLKHITFIHFIRINLLHFHDSPNVYVP